jgi:hypothetical protein
MVYPTPEHAQAHMSDLRRSGGSAENAIHRFEAVAERRRARLARFSQYAIGIYHALVRS